MEDWAFSRRIKFLSITCIVAVLVAIALKVSLPTTTAPSTASVASTANAGTVISVATSSPNITKHTVQVTAEATSVPQIVTMIEQRQVKDLGDFLSTDQESQLAQEAAKLISLYQIDIVIVTTRDTGGTTSQVFADDYFDNNGFGIGPNKDGILFLLDYANRQAYISTTGKGIRYLTDHRINLVLDEVMAAGLGYGKNFEACKAFLSKTSEFLIAGIP